VLLKPVKGCLPLKHNQESGFPLKSKYDLGSLQDGFMFPPTTALRIQEASFAKKQRIYSVDFISSYKSFPTLLMLCLERK
jgi:hypothetical protein